MNNLILRKVTVTANYQPLSAGPLVGSVTISCPPGNIGVVNFRGDDGSDVPWIPGEWHDFQRINLAEVQVKGTAGDTVTIVGGTW
ncbi:hypothetical protein [Fontivita pretiosa]|uniref:hypothetical protein n=1 Tax=Fontivita pretiosa TaxID=2989684 RepID=UPI003D166DB4